MRFSIRFKLLLFSFFIILLVGGGISLYGIYQGRQQILNTFQEEAVETIAMISRHIASDLYYLNVGGLRQRLENTHLNPDFSFIYVTDADGFVLADGTRRNAMRDSQLADPFSKDMMRADNWIWRMEDRILKVGGPILTADETRIGFLQMGFSLKNARTIIRQTTATSLFITALCLGIGAVLAVFLATSFTRPILNITHAAREIGNGKLDTRVRMRRSDELGLLSESVNQMAINLTRNIQRIQALHEINLATTSTLVPQEVLESLLSKAAQLLPSSAVTVTLWNRETKELVPITCRNLDEEEWKASWSKIAPTAVGELIDKPQPVISEDIQTDPRTSDPSFFVKNGLISFLGLPLIAHGNVLGVLCFHFKERHAFTAEETAFLSDLAGHAAVAIHNSQLYERIKMQAVELEKADRAKTEFLSVVSHELRTPLNVVMGYTQLIYDGNFGEIGLEQKVGLGKVLNQSHCLLTMINGILEVTRIEVGEARAQWHEVELQDLLDDLRSIYSIPSGKKVELVWDYPQDLPVMETDRDKLKQVLQNLINNALKFTEEGRITLSARYCGGKNNVQFKVTDTGIGIAEKDLPIVFEKFRQVDSSETRSFGGVGLGLYIVKTFTEMLGGSVGIESELGHGTAFTVILPCGNHRPLRSGSPQASVSSHI
ncbi:MAG: ATP-binding protein [Candidatus Binatia bacterium]